MDPEWNAGGDEDCDSRYGLTARQNQHLTQSPVNREGTRLATLLI